MVLGKLRETGLKLSPQKCCFSVAFLDYLGYEITSERCQFHRTAPNAYTIWNRPALSKQPGSLMDFCPGSVGTWNRSQKSILVEVANSDKFYRNAELNQDFLALRNALLTRPALARLAPEDRFILSTNCSISGLSGPHSKYTIPWRGSLPTWQ